MTGTAACSIVRTGPSNRKSAPVGSAIAAVVHVAVGKNDLVYPLPAAEILQVRFGNDGNAVRILAACE